MLRVPPTPCDRGSVPGSSDLVPIAGDRGDVPGYSDTVSSAARRVAAMDHTVTTRVARMISIRKPSTSTFIARVSSSGV